MFILKAVESLKPKVEGWRLVTTERSFGREAGLRMTILIGWSEVAERFVRRQARVAARFMFYFTMGVKPRLGG